MSENKIMKSENNDQKVTIDRIVLYTEPITERHTLDAFNLFKKKTLAPRLNYRAVVYVREKLPVNRHYYTLTYVPGFFNLNPGDIINHSRLVELEDKHRQKVKRWVETSNSRFIIAEKDCGCKTTEPKIHLFTMKPQ